MEHMIQEIIKKIIKGICIALVIALAIFGFSYITMQLWNWLMPDIFGLKIITYWQALGLLILGKILFSGFGGKGGNKCGHHGGWKGHRGGMWKKRWEAKMANMTPEEKEKFKQGYSKCGWGNDSDCEDEKIPDSK